MSSPTLLSFLLFTVVFLKKNICYFIILVRNSSRGVLIFFFLLVEFGDLFFLADLKSSRALSNNANRENAALKI